MFNFTGSAKVSVGCTVTCRSRKPLSTTMTEAALVFGIPPGVNSVGAGIVSGVSFALARARCERLCVDFDVFALRVGVDSASASCWSSDELALACLSFALTAFALRTGPETPLGRTASESAASWLHAFGADARMRTQRNQSQWRDNFMGRKLATKLLTAQVPGANANLLARILSRARSVQSRMPFSR